MKSSELVRLVKKAGWIYERTAGSHMIFKNPEGTEHVSVPFHGSREVKTGTAKAILKKVGAK